MVKVLVLGQLPYFRDYAQNFAKSSASTYSGGLARKKVFLYYAFGYSRISLFSVAIDKFENILQFGGSHDFSFYCQNCPQLFSVSGHCVDYLNCVLSFKLKFLR